MVAKKTLLPQNSCALYLTAKCLRRLKIIKWWARLKKKKKRSDDELNEAFKKFGLLEDDLKSEFDHRARFTVFSIYNWSGAFNS